VSERLKFSIPSALYSRPRLGRGETAYRDAPGLGKIANEMSNPSLRPHGRRGLACGPAAAQYFQPGAGFEEAIVRATEKVATIRPELR
jgi:hypothetical protein